MAAAATTAANLPPITYRGPRQRAPRTSLADGLPFSWNGLDAYGRRLQGGQPIAVRVGNTYSGVYQNVDLFGLSGNGVSFNINGRDITVWQSWNSTIALWDAEPAGFGGWGLDIHHSYDVSGQTLRFGNGDNLTAADVPPVIQTVAGIGNVSGGTNGDGGPATSAVVSPESVAIGPDGSFYIADTQDCVRRVTPDGIIGTFAGQCSNSGFSGDGGPATAAQLHGPEDLAFGPDGSLYIADTNNERIRRVFPDGIIQTVTGSGPTGNSAGGFSGDGGPALQAVFQQPWGVDVTADGTIYIADLDNGRIRRVGPDGTVTTVAGNGTNLVSSDVLATATALSGPMKVGVAPDGSFYVAEFNGDVVRRVGTDGIIQSFAGWACNRSIRRPLRPESSRASTRRPADFRARSSSRPARSRRSRCPTERSRRPPTRRIHGWASGSCRRCRR